MVLASKVAKIMSVRTVPNGDERDKDVANAIRYAVDNGAKVLNMSFGKPVSPGKNVVWDALNMQKIKEFF
jgi:subtilisin family serine protease